MEFVGFNEMSEDDICMNEINALSKTHQLFSVNPGVLHMEGTFNTPSGREVEGLWYTFVKKNKKGS